MTDKRVLLVSEDGTAEVNGVEYVLVPKEPTEAMLIAEWNTSTFGRSPDEARAVYSAMLAAAPIDLSGLPRVPERKGDENWGDLATWNDALDAMGVK